MANITERLAGLKLETHLVAGKTSSASRALPIKAEPLWNLYLTYKPIAALEPPEVGP